VDKERQIMSRPSGFSIVEALVALVVLSVGMLGIAALYVESLRAGRTAVYRTQAVNLASDMADRIRANRNALGAWALAPTDNPADQGCVAGTTNCSAAQLAQDDQASWRLAIQQQLPGSPTANPATPFGTIQVINAVVPNQYVITVTWSEPGEQQALTYALTMEL
jgi:type IV pilus assembly protein PilV